jgi:pantetheine-phosphate adenylyltransferase
VTVAGTFNGLHKGHIALLMKAFEVGEYVLLCLSSDKFVEKMKKSHDVSSYNERIVELESFLRKNNLCDRTQMLPLDDAYGIALSNRDLEAIIVSQDTEIRAREINEKRTALGFPQLEIIPIKMILAENGIPISTTRIMCKEIDREGHVRII